MDLDFSPIVSGTVGGLVAVWLGHALRGQLPLASRPSEQRLLSRTFAWPVRLANGAFVAVILLGMWLVAPGGHLDNDWRALGIGLGGGVTASVLVLAAGTFFVRGRFVDALRAWAINQKAPLYMLVPIIGAAIALFVFTLTRL